MKKTFPLFAATLSLLTIAGAAMGIDRAYAAPQSKQATATATTQAVVDAANAFLATLGAEQRSAVQFGFAPQEAATIARFARTGP